MIDIDIDLLNELLMVVTTGVGVGLFLSFVSITFSFVITSVFNWFKGRF